MKKAVLMSYFCLFVFASFGQMSNNMEEDKIKHVIAGAVISVAATELIYTKTKNHTTSVLVGVGVGVLFGFMKEVYDSSGRGNRDVKDFLWTSAGSTLPTISFVIHL
jgi:uncharacterized protein YfiM (DUF2279 family)